MNHSIMSDLKSLFAGATLNFKTLAIYSRPPTEKEERGSKVHDSLRM